MIKDCIALIVRKYYNTNDAKPGKFPNSSELIVTMDKFQTECHFAYTKVAVMRQIV